MMTDLLLFRVGRELFATELGAVEEAVDLTAVEAVRQLPGTDSPVRSIFTLRGALVPLFSPMQALGAAPSEAATALVVRDGRRLIAIAVDDVEDVLTLRDGEVRPVPAGDTRDTGVLRGVVRRGTTLVALVDLGALIAACRGTSQPEAA
jgi:chemotaxis signal transduction protein